MASKRRGGFRAPELRGTLGTLLRTTTDAVRDALERGASAGRDVLERGASASRARLDDVRSSRRRTDALAELGELVLDLIRRGEIDLAELPEARDLVRHLDELDTADEPDEPRAAVRRRFDDRDGRAGTDTRVWRPHDDAADRAFDERTTRPPLPRAFDDRPTRAPDERGFDDRPTRAPDERARSFDDRPTRAPVHRSTDDERSGRHAPPLPREERFARPPSAPRPTDDEDGTVSSGAAFRASRPTTPARPRPPETESSRAPTKPMKGPWRRPEPAEPPPEPISEAPSRPYRLAPDPHRRGGISFDDDDLNEYMHPDDVPPKSPPRDPDASDS